MPGWLRNLLGPRGPGRRSGGGQAAKNDAVRAQLRAHGDDGTRVRHVIHFALPDTPDAAAKPEVRAALSGDGDAVTFTQTEDSTGVVFEMRREVASLDFDTMTERYAALMRSHGWKYDGWECAVEAGN